MVGNVARIRTCYISSPAGTNLERVRAALIRRNINVVVPEEILPGADWAEQIARNIGNVDLVVGVLTAERRSQWVLFELGQAAALDRQIMLIAPPKLASVPSHLRRFLVVRGSVRNTDAFEFALDQLLASPERATPQTPHLPEPRRTLGLQTDEILEDLHSALASRDYAGVEQAVGRALRGAGTDVISEAHSTRPAADLAVWSDALQPFVGNPLLIEIKARTQGMSALRRAAQQLAAVVAARGAGWGLLLYGEEPASPPPSERSLPPTIPVYPIEKLIRELGARSFADVVRDLRNRRVHGGEP